MAYQTTKTKMNMLLTASTLVSLAITLSFIAGFPQESPIPPQAGAVAGTLLTLGYIYGLLTRNRRVSTASVAGLILQLIHETIFLQPAVMNIGILLLRFTAIIFLLELSNIRASVPRVLDGIDHEADGLSLVAIRHLNVHFNNRLTKVTGLLTINYLLSLALLLLGGTLGTAVKDFLPSSLQVALIAICLIALGVWTKAK